MRRWVGAASILAVLAFPPPAAAQPPAPKAQAPTEAANEQPDNADCPPHAYCEVVELEPGEATTPAPVPDDEEAEGPPMEEGDTRVEPRPSFESEQPDWSAGPHDGRSNSDDGVATAGLIIFAIGYVPAFVVGIVAAAAEEDDVDDEHDLEALVPLLLPVAGPPITGALVDASEGTWTVLLVDTAIQALGLIILGVGLAAEDDGHSAAGPIVLPYVAGDGKRSLSLGVQGRF